jgi:orotidine-5'-phosphate decarboxylase
VLTVQVLKRKLAAASYVRKSRLIVGLDFTANMAQAPGKDPRQERDRLEKDALRVISSTADYAVAFKFNYQLVLPLGLFDRVPSLIDKIHGHGLTAIMDCKMNDIGNTNEHAARYYYDAGFDAIIANPMVGWEGGLDSVFKLAQAKDRGIITLCYMSHPAADEGYGLNVAVDKKMKAHEPLYIIFARRAQSWKSDGVIVGATYPEKITEVKEILGDEIPIIAPGVGAQGGSAADAITAGASYVIAVRSIIESADPGAAAKALAAETQRASS